MIYLTLTDLVQCYKSLLRSGFDFIVVAILMKIRLLVTLRVQYYYYITVNTTYPPKIVGKILF